MHVPNILVSEKVRQAMTSWKHWIGFFFALIFSVNVFARPSAPPDRIAAQDLPLEARQTLVLIKRGGPFPFVKDGVVFGNYEGLLPKRKRGYYHEFTVPTPGSRSRGARRIISGGDPMLTEEFYYTDNHYASFRRIDSK
jgi:ribonuclease T1